MFASRLTMMALAPAAIVGAAAATAFLIASRCCAKASDADSSGSGGGKPVNDQSEPPAHDYVRPAGPGEMENPPSDGWSDVDEASDESFPASDPPGNY